jgi:hypothetical protein
MIPNLDFQECIIPTNGKRNAYEWLINQDHIPFDMSSDAHGMYWQFYTEFLKDIQELYYKTGDKYYWYTQSGNLVSDEGRQVISSNSVRIDLVKLRNQKIDFILD